MFIAVMRLTWVGLQGFQDRQDGLVNSPPRPSTSRRGSGRRRPSLHQGSRRTRGTWTTSAPRGRRHRPARRHVGLHQAAQGLLAWAKATSPGCINDRTVVMDVTSGISSACAVMPHGPGIARPVPGRWRTTVRDARDSAGGACGRAEPRSIDLRSSGGALDRNPCTGWRTSAALGAPRHHHRPTGGVCW